jgi:hypothetical protein
MPGLHMAGLLMPIARATILVEAMPAYCTLQWSMFKVISDDFRHPTAREDEAFVTVSSPAAVCGGRSLATNYRSAMKRRTAPSDTAGRPCKYRLPITACLIWWCGVRVDDRL